VVGTCVKSSCEPTSLIISEVGSQELLAYDMRLATTEGRCCPMSKNTLSHE